MKVTTETQHIKSNVFNSFMKTINSPSSAGIRSLRYKNSEKVETSAKIAVSAGSIIGAMLPVLLFAKMQNKNFKKFGDILNIEYGLTEMLGVSAGSILGAVGAGFAADKKGNKKKKISEGVFQFLNTGVPSIMGWAMLKICENIKTLNNIPAKIAASVAGLALGMPLAAKLSNKINDPKDLVPDRKVTAKDAFANIDDAFGILILAKFPIAQKLHLNKVLPAIFAWCGYRAGQSN